MGGSKNYQSPAAYREPGDNSLKAS